MSHIAWRLAPLPAILLAALVAVRTGVPITAFFPNVVGLAFGCGLLWAVTRFNFNFSKWSFALGVGSALTLALTFLFEGLDGVHRWIWLGPISLNASVAVLPILVWSILDQFDRSFFRAVALTIATVVLHTLQPDSGQSIVFACALTTAVAMIRRGPGKNRIAVATLALIGIALSFIRRDALVPIEHVERILPMIANQGIPEAVELLFAVATLFAPFWLQPHSAERRDENTVASALLASALLVTYVGNFPTPVFGAGFAGVFSWYVLMALVRPRPV